MAAKLRDGLVMRLAELAEAKVCQPTFYFAARKLNVLMAEADTFSEFIRKNRLKEKRNKDISHKELGLTRSSRQSSYAADVSLRPAARSYSPGLTSSRPA